MKELIKQILKEELSLRVRRLINFDNMDDIVKKTRVVKFQKDKPIKNSINSTIYEVAHELMGNQLDNLEDEEYWKEYDELKKFLTDTFEEELIEYFEKRQRDADEETNPLELKYVFVKHDKPYYDRGWRGFTDSFNSFNDMITRYGNWVDVDWDEIKKKLDTINDFPDNQFNGWYYSRPLRIKSVGDKGNKWGYNFSIIKAIPYENLDKIVKESKDPKVGTGKKPEGSGRRLYTDENPSDTVSVKFRTKEDIIDTLNKGSFKSKPHKRQSQIINLIHQRVRAAYQNAKDPETKQRLKRGLDYIENEKEKSKEKTKRLQKEGLHDTSWENDKGDKITLIDLLNATEDIPVETISVEQLKPHVLFWDGDEEEIKKIEKSDLQYPILIFVEDDGSFISIIDGHHRAQKALRKGLDTIKAKIIPINLLPKNIRKVFSHMGKQEQNENVSKRQKFDFQQLVDDGVLWITQPHVNGQRVKPNWKGDSNVITLWNIEHPEEGQEWVQDAIKYPKPEAIEWWTQKGQDTLSDTKYRQILRSIKLVDSQSKNEFTEGELTERCWKGYTQKGMKTMFGKRYPNCVKIKK